MTIPRRKLFFSIIAAVALLLTGVVLALLFLKPHSAGKPFDGQRAYQDILAQMALGPRTVGSEAHTQVIAYIQQQLKQAGWRVQIQSTQWKGFPVQNIIATRGGTTPQILLGAHYDSRSLADQDTGPGKNAPVPGANDGASGVAVLLELARALPSNTVPVELVFLDAEDDGGLSGREWSMGSRAFVASLTEKPQAVVIVDMVGDKDLNLYIERNSNFELASAIWKQAAALGFDKQFIYEPKWSMIDDHTPFLEAGIPAVDIIDFDYPYWHTSADTADKVAPKSLYIVGETLRQWLLAQK